MVASAHPPKQLEILEGTLQELVPTLVRLREYNVAQRQAVAEGDLRRVITLTAEQEQVSARVATLEQRRQESQRGLETTLNTSGLSSIVSIATQSETEQQRFMMLLEDVRREVTQLQYESKRSVQVLETAIGGTSRIREYMERLNGVQASYEPALARRVRAARRTKAYADASQIERADPSTSAAEAS